MQLTSATKMYTVSKLLFVGPRDQVYYQFSAHRSDRKPYQSKKAKQAKYTLVKYITVCSTDSIEDAEALYTDICRAHRLDRLCMNIDAKCMLTAAESQRNAMSDDYSSNLNFVNDGWPEACTAGFLAYMKSLKSTPWLYAMSNRPASQLAWANAEDIYDYWKEMEGKRGSGGRAISNLFSRRLGDTVHAYRVVAHFKSGWNPHTDIHWQTYYH